MEREPRADDAPVIETHDLTRVFGSYTAVDRLNLSVPRGAIYGFIGSNGSGKSTLLRLATGELSPDHGTVSVPGQHGQQTADSEESTATSIAGYLDAVCAETLDALDRFERMGAGA